MHFKFGRQYIEVANFLAREPDIFKFYCHGCTAVLHGSVSFKVAVSCHFLREAKQADFFAFPFLFENASHQINFSKIVLFPAINDHYSWREFNR